MIKIFYSYSNHNQIARDTYFKICEYFEKNNENVEIIDVDNTDQVNNILLLGKILTHISSANIFISDITTDYLINQSSNQLSTDCDYTISSKELEICYDKLYPVISSNVAIELGYALSNLQENNIILIQNDLSSNKIPSLIQGLYLLKYNSFEDIIIKIKEYTQNINFTNDTAYKKFKYKLTEKSIYIINQLLDIQYFKNYDIIFNSKYKFLILYKNNSRRQINITTKTFNLKTKDICLSYYPELYEELKHIEILINFKILNQST
jgi:hypothetical protein